MLWSCAEPRSLESSARLHRTIENLDPERSSEVVAKRGCPRADSVHPGNPRIESCIVCTMALGRITMKKWPILLVVLCLALLGQDQDREAKYHLVPYDSIRDHSLFRIVHERPEKRGPVDIARNPLIQTKIL